MKWSDCLEKAGEIVSNQRKYDTKDRNREKKKLAQNSQSYIRTWCAGHLPCKHFDSRAFAIEISNGSNTSRLKVLPLFLTAISLSLLPLHRLDVFPSICNRYLFPKSFFILTFLLEFFLLLLLLFSSLCVCSFFLWLELFSVIEWNRWRECKQQKHIYKYYVWLLRIMLFAPVSTSTNR